MIFIEPDENRYYSEFRKKGRIKKCFLCDKEKEVITSHSISKKKCLSLLVERKGHNLGVYGFEHLKFRTDENWYHPYNFGNFDLVGIDKASTFKGFCKSDDQLLFREIDESPFDRESEKQKFLYCFRAFAYGYHKKKEREKSCMAESNYKREHHVSVHENLLGVQTGLNVDINEYPLLMKQWVNTKEYFHFKHFHCKTNSFIPIASSSMCEPTFSILNNRLNNYFDTSTPLNHIFINIIPEEECTHILISAFNDQPKAVQFISEIEQVYKTDREEVGLFITTLLVFHTENTYMAPSLIDNLTETTRRNLLLNLRHILTEGIEDELLDRPIRGSLNLFRGVL